jgi:hypothetical protein
MDQEPNKGNPYDMNSSSFDADKYLQNLIKVSEKKEKNMFDDQLNLPAMQFETNHGYGGDYRKRHANSSIGDANFGL